MIRQVRQIAICKSRSDYLHPCEWIVLVQWENTGKFGDHPLICQSFPIKHRQIVNTLKRIRTITQFAKVFPFQSYQNSAQL